MTNDELIAKIKAEIERLTDELELQARENAEANNGEATDYCFGIVDMQMNLLSFLSTLEESEKPMNLEKMEREEELKKEVHQVSEEIVKEIFPDDLENGDFFTEVDLKNCIKRVAYQFADWQKEQMMDEWLKDRDGCFWDGVEEGKKAMKEQMLKDAVRWLVDDDYDPQTDKGRFLLGSAGLGYNGYYIPYSDLLKLPKEGDQ